MVTFYIIMAILTMCYATTISERNNETIKTLAKNAGQPDWFMAQPNYQQIFWIGVCWPGYIFGKLYTWYQHEEKI